jgi:F0F1-type ATP synthase beta subunit
MSVRKELFSMTRLMERVRKEKKASVSGVVIVVVDVVDVDDPGPRY